MTDIFSKRKRSEIMASIHPKNTKIENIIFSGLRKQGVYFQKHYGIGRSSIDIALPGKKKAVFIDGDFWHGFNFEKNKKRLPKKYWLEKIGDNVVRDKKNRMKLKKEGWKVLRIWEHEIKKNPKKTIQKLIKFLTK